MRFLGHLGLHRNLNNIVLFLSAPSFKNHKWGGDGGLAERRWRDWSKNMYEGPTDMDNGVGIDRGSRGWAWGRGAKGNNWNNCNSINTNIF